MHDTVLLHRKLYAFFHTVQKRNYAISLHMTNIYKKLFLFLLSQNMEYTFFLLIDEHITAYVSLILSENQDNISCIKIRKKCP